MSSADLFCNACHLEIDDADVRKVHYKSEWHRYNVKRRCAGLRPVPEKLFNRKLATLRGTKDAPDTPKGCELCRKTFKSAKALENHYNTKSHQKKLAKSSGVGLVMTYEDPLADSKTVASTDGTTDMKDVKTSPKPKEKKAIPLKNCLFCPSTFDDISSSLTHMYKRHGFFLPYLDYMADLEGLLEYLGYKIGVGHVCLWCNGKGRACYPDKYACWQHMDAKSHCKLQLEEDAEDEFLQFYNFPSLGGSDDEDGDVDMAGAAERDEKKQLALSKKRRHLVGIADNGELRMSDGALIGHRSLKQVYNMNLKPDESRESVLVLKELAKYRALALPGYRNKSNYSEEDRAVQAFIKKQRLRVKNRQMKRSNKILSHHFRDQNGLK